MRSVFSYSNLNVIFLTHVYKIPAAFAISLIFSLRSSSLIHFAEHFPSRCSFWATRTLIIKYTSTATLKLGNSNFNRWKRRSTAAVNRTQFGFDFHWVLPFLIQVFNEKPIFDIFHLENILSRVSRTTDQQNETKRRTWLKIWEQPLKRYSLHLIRQFLNNSVTLMFKLATYKTTLAVRDNLANFCIL